jgi:16S rRNA (guanine527-N7)-methyltransferase
MNIGSPQWNQILVDGARTLGFKLSAEDLEQFKQYACELLRWNAKINLTRIIDPVDIAVKHIVDSLQAAPLLNAPAKLLDIGSGAGFPGIPLKILNPDLQVTLIEATQKKVNFLKHLIRTLQLDNIAVWHVRAESLHRQPAVRHSFDVIVSRALSALQPFIQTALPLLARGGRLIGYRSKMAPHELETVRAATLDAAWRVEQIVYTLPVLNLPRALIIISPRD